MQLHYQNWDIQHKISSLAISIRERNILLQITHQISTRSFLLSNSALARIFQLQYTAVPNRTPLKRVSLLCGSQMIMPSRFSTGELVGALVTGLLRRLVLSGVTSNFVSDHPIV
jgi:hypothetical protein